MNSQGNTWNRDQAGQNQEPQAGSGGQDNSKWDQAAEKQGENSGTNTEKSDLFLFCRLRNRKI